jgi:hypothetical protein
MPSVCRWTRSLFVASLLMLSQRAAWPADASAGALRFATPPQPGLLACADCHSDNPQQNNFGNIWSGRNAVALIRRAVDNNTGGMGYFNNFYRAEDFANIAAYLGNSPASLSFPATALGSTSAAQTVTIASSTKTGFSGLLLDIEGEFVRVGGSCGNTLARFDSCTVELAFRPTATGTRSGALLITHDGTPTPVRVALSGEGPARPKAVASATPAAWDFGATPLGAAGLRRAVVVANDSPETLTLGAITAVPADFIIAGGSCVAGAALLAGQRCVVTVLFNPLAAGERRGSLTVQHDGVGGISSVALSGLANTASATHVETDEAALDFAVVPVGDRSATRSVSLINRGTAAIRWRELTSNDAIFMRDGGSCTLDTPLQPQQRCQVELSFRPTRSGNFSAEFRATPVGDGAAVRVPLSGRAASSRLLAVPSRLAVAEVLGETRMAELTLVNPGSSSWTLSSLALAGPEMGDFALVAGQPGGCRVGTTVPPGSACRVALAFAPRAAGERIARLTVSHDAVATPTVIELKGQGLATAVPELWLDAAVLRFADRSVGAGFADITANNTTTVTMWNRGRATLAWQHITVQGEQAGDFPSDRSAATACDIGRAVAPMASCTIDLRFLPKAAGSRGATLVLWPRGADAPALVSLGGVGVATSTTSPASSGASHASAAVGAGATQATFAVVNPSNVNAAALTWTFSGDAANEFSVDPNSSCARGSLLAPGARCSLQVNFHPAQAGSRSAVLGWGESALPTLALHGRGIDAALGDLRALPQHVSFQARSGNAAPAQRVILQNVGPASLSVTSIRLLGTQGTPEPFTASAEAACASATVPLLPGETCSIDVTWSGSAAAAAGASLGIGSGDALGGASVALAVSEDPAQISNQGQGGGALTLSWLLALLLCVVWAAHAESRRV